MPSTCVRPYSHLFRQGIIAIVAFMAPVFVVLYFLTVPDGEWPVVLATHIGATIAVGIASAMFFMTAIWVDETGIAERGYFGRRTRYNIEDIGSIVMARTFVGDATESVDQLFVCDLQGKQLVRMRGQFWSRESMDIVVESLGLPVTCLDDTVSTSELRLEHPGLLYWFERHPVLGALAFVAATAVFGILLWAVLHLSDISMTL